MDHILLQKHIHYALLVLLTAQWGRVLAAPVTPQSGTLDPNLKLAVCLSSVVLHDATQLLDIYERIHDFTGDSLHEDVPDVAVTGSSTAERLHSVAVTERLLHGHLGVVEVDHRDFWGNPDEGLRNAIATAKARLSQHFQTTELLLKAMDLNFVSPTSATPSVDIPDAFAKKSYGWGVLSKLKALATEVERELIEMNGNRTCGEEYIARLLSV